MHVHFHPVDFPLPPESDLPPSLEGPSCGPKKVWMQASDCASESCIPILI
jgi:hypothetical protein